MGERGSKFLTSRDWIFGSRPRRLALMEVLRSKLDDPVWTKKDLAKALGLSPNGGVHDHVEGFVELGLLERQDDGRFRRADPLPPIAEVLEQLLSKVEELPDRRPSWRS